MQRVLVVGTSGAGKTTVAAALARQLAVPHIELDTLFWEPNWEQADFDVFRGRIVDAIATDGWVVCGNYRPATIDITWPRADTVVWLDLARHLIMRRIIMRTAVRIGRRDALWNGNRESLRGAVARDSIIRWAWTSFARNRERYTEMATDPRLAHLRWVRLQSPRAVQRFLQTSVA